MFGGPFRARRGAMMRANPVFVQAVARANQLVANGQTPEAAKLLAQLAQEAENRGWPRIGANMHAQAAHAFVRAKDEANALTHARTALNQFTQWSMLLRVPRFYANITTELRGNGMGAAADKLQQEFGEKVRQLGSQGFAAPTGHGRLPDKCPHCAAPARSDEVEWIDDHSAECNFCGSVIQTV